MKKSTVYKLIIAAILLIATVIFAILDNEAVFPSTLVGFFLVLTLVDVENTNKAATGRAAKYAVIIFSILVIVLNIFITLLMPIAAASLDLSSYSVELSTSIGTTDTKEIANHFVEVTINDMHELCYSTSVLLFINIIFLLVYRIKLFRKKSIND